MRRKLFSFASFVSLLLAVAVLVSWGRSYFVSDNGWAVRSPAGSGWAREVSVRSFVGILGFGFDVHEFPPDRRAEYLGYFVVSPGVARPAAGWVAEPLDPSRRDWFMRHNAGGGLLQFRAAKLILNSRRRAVPGSVPANRVRYDLMVPHWVVALALLACPVVWLRGWTRTRRRVRSGLCVWCGYDLRESPDRCPECGTAVATNRRESGMNFPV